MTDVDEVAQRLSAALARAYAELTAAQLRVLDGFGESGRLAAARLQQFLDALEQFQHDFSQQAAAFVRSDLPALYATAALAASAQPFTWTTMHIEAVTALAADSYSELLARSQEAGRTGQAFARAVRSAARERISLAATGNSTAREAGLRLRDELEGRYDLSRVTYANGSLHAVTEYAQVVARTKTAVAYNMGSLNRWQELDIGWVEVFDGSACGWEGHDDGDKANATIRSAAQAAAHPISHPNCRRAFGARPEISNAAAAKRATPSTTPQQRADQAAFEGATRSAQRLRAARAQRRTARTG
jgi:hypothetical protein